MVINSNSKFNSTMAKVQITAKELASKMRSKEEAYRFLADDCDAFLPHPKCVTIWHLGDLVHGKKKYIKGGAVKHLHVP